MYSSPKERAQDATGMLVHLKKTRLVEGKFNPDVIRNFWELEKSLILQADAAFKEFSPEFPKSRLQVTEEAEE